jgi:hypothetical protein
MSDSREDDALAAFADPAHVRHLLESIGASGELAIPVDCGFAHPGTLPAVTELVAGGYIAAVERTVAVADVFALTARGVALAVGAGVIGNATAGSVPAPADTDPDAMQVGDGPNRAAAEAIARLIFAQVKRHLSTRPSPWRVYEVLNALGMTAATVIAGTGTDQHELRGFFFVTVDDQIAALVKDGLTGARDTTV